MGCEDGDVMGKYRQVKTAKLRAYRRYGIIGMVDNIRVEDSGGRERWQRCGTTGMDKAVEKMRDGNRRDVGQRRWQNGLGKRLRTGKY